VCLETRWLRQKPWFVEEPKKNRKKLPPKKTLAEKTQEKLIFLANIKEKSKKSLPCKNAKKSQETAPQKKIAVRTFFVAVPAVMLEDVPRDIVFKSLKVSGVCAPVFVCVCVCVCVRARATSICVRENVHLHFVIFCLCVCMQQGKHIAVCVCVCVCVCVFVCVSHTPKQKLINTIFFSKGQKNQHTNTHTPNKKYYFFFFKGEKRVQVPQWPPCCRSSASILGWPSLLASATGVSPLCVCEREYECE